MEKTKTIKLERRELVWEYYSAEWDEKDWKSLQEYYQRRAEEKVDEESRWHKTNVLIYDIIKNITWEEAWADFRKWQNGDEDAIHWEEDHSWTDINDVYHEYMFKQYLGEFIEEQIRQDCWDNGPDDCEGADDSDEDWYIEEDGHIVEDEEDEENN